MCANEQNLEDQEFTVGIKNKTVQNTNINNIALQWGMLEFGSTRHKNAGRFSIQMLEEDYQ